jgi:hypothetical protein
MICPLCIDFQNGWAVPIAQPAASSSPESLHPGMERRELEKGRRKLRTE